MQFIRKNYKIIITFLIVLILTELAVSYYQCMQRYGDTLISFELSDTYDFSEIRTIYVDTAESEFGLNLSVGTLANDAGLLSQADGVLTPFSFTISFEVSVPRNQEVVFV